ncbi:recombinase family protein [Furfurilactobacillus curtus]|uniref:Recombinase RecA n=1 Tax=Furfurilactobacillus curtus TaxID=1746200 RepID=A0ABQ5JMB7_9LACO
MTNQAVAYYRVSSRRQSHNWSIMAQQEAVHEEAGRLFLTIEAEFHDIKSGSNLNRPGMNELSNAIRSGRYGHVLVWRLNRLTRSLKDFLLLLNLCEENSVVLHSVMEPVDVNIMGRFQQQLYVMFGEWQLGILKVNQNNAYRQKFREGQLLSSSVPLGYYYTKGLAKIDSETSKIVKFIYENYLEGDVGYRKLSRAVMNKFDYQLTANGVAKVLQNQAYVGKLVNRYGVSTKVFPRLVTDTQFNNAQALRKSRRVKQKFITNPLFKKKLRCPYCQGILTASHVITASKSRIDYWYCSRDYCKGIRVDEQRVLNQLTAVISGLVTSDFKKSLMVKLNDDWPLQTRQDVVPADEMFRKFETGGITVDELETALTKSSMPNLEIERRRHCRKLAQQIVYKLTDPRDEDNIASVVKNLNFDRIEITMNKDIGGVFLAELPAINLLSLRGGK